MVITRFNGYTKNALEVLGALYMRTSALGDDVWVRPYEIGGHGHSHHSRTLASLHKKNLCARRPYNPTHQRSSWTYQLTSEGKQVWEVYQALKAD